MSEIESQHRTWPKILDRYVRTEEPSDAGQYPRKVIRRYHGHEIEVWQGRVHIDDVGGWVDNVRLKHYLRRWQARRGTPTATPGTQEIYEIMVEADREENAESKRPFHIERMATNIAANGVQEPIFVAVDGNGIGTLWDGNRRRYATQHIMFDPKYRNVRNEVQWIPAYIYVLSGDPIRDEKLKHAVLTELNFKEKDHIP